METQEQQKPQTVSVTNPYLLRLKCFLCQAPNTNVNDENNNLKKDNNTNEKSFNPISKLPLYTCPDCEAKIRLEEKETASTSTVTSQELEGESDRMIIVPDTSSDDDYWCQSCTDDEHDSNNRQLWDDLSHIIKCVYRATDKDFSENHFSDDICKAKEYVKKLSDINSQSLFNKLESIVLEYVREIRNQVLQRFHTCSKTSHDVQLFISFLLDEYNMFIQAANNVSTIVSYLEEHYMKSFNLTWLLYNKHLYEKLIYMDRKIQHSMSTMIDLLQPSNELDNDYPPAEYTQLLNRFLAFDEEMSEIACLYKDFQAKTKSPSLDIRICNGYQTENNTKIKNKKKCKKIKKSKQLQTSTEDNTNSSSTTAVDIPTSNVTLSAPVPPEQGSNGSSIGSGIGGDESSSVSSVDDYLLDNETSSSGYTQEEQEDFDPLFTEEDLNELLLEGLLDGISPLAKMHHEIMQSRLNEKQTDSSSTTTTSTIDNDKWIKGIIQGIKSAHEQEQKATSNDVNTNVRCTTTKEVTNVPTSSESSKKSSSTKSKSHKSSHRRKETTTTTTQATTTTTSTSQIPKKSIAADLILPRSIADLSAKIQSVSFTAGTFGSITSENPTKCYDLSSSSNCSTTTLTAAKTTTSTGQTRLSINLTRKPGAKTTEHGGQKIAEALFNELTGFGTNECLNSGRKKDNQQFKKSKQQRSTINETLLNSTNNTHSFFNSTNKSDLNASSSSSSTASNNLDYLLRNAASNTDVSEAALHSILSSFHSQTCLDPSISTTTTTSSSSSKYSISSKTSEALQTLLAQQHHHHHHHHHQQQQQKRNLSNNNTSNNTNTNKHCEFCCCEFSEGRTCSTSSTCLHLSSTSNTLNGPITSCVTCMALPGTTTTTSVIGATITGGCNQRDVQVKERLQLKLNKRNVQNLNEQQTLAKDQQKKTTTTTTTAAATTNKKQPIQNNTKSKECFLTDKNDIDDLVRFIDGNETISSNNNEHQTSSSSSSSTTTITNESTSKKNKKKKDKQSKVNHTEEIKTNSSQSKEQQQQQTNQKKQNRSNITQQTTTSQQPSRSTSSSSTSTKVTSGISSTPPVNDETQQPLSKRKQKAKLKLEQQQKQATNNMESSSPVNSNTTVTTITPTPASTVPVTVLPGPSSSSASSSSSQGINSARTSVDLPSESFDTTEEEVNWITISRKQSKHKPSPVSVPSLLATPILPVMPPTNTKRQQQQQTMTNTKKVATTTNGSSLAQQKVIPTAAVATSPVPPETTLITNKQQQTTIAPSRLQNVMKNHTVVHQPQKVEPPLESQPTSQPPLNLWTNNNIHDHTLAASSTLLPTTSSFIPSHLMPSPSLVAPIPIGGTSNITPSSSMLSEGLSSSLYWDPNGYLLPSSSQSTIAGPVQRPSPSFSPAPGAVNNTTSRCIQRPSPEPRSCSANNVPFPLYSPMNYAAGSSTSTWNDTPITNTHESQWNYPQEQQQQIGSSITSTDFPLYDPFHSGAVLNIPSTTQSTLLSNGFSEHFTDLCTFPQNNDINEMDALDKEIEDFKKFCFETVPLETREKVQVNVDRCFVRQA
ncbi:unnamed protein product [Adineta steineri]|uniref:FAM193 C-terminal domain-containing protein n=1 Tax=Adineta steineri TaxID=433720 RepID=A0A813NQ70_9BILA|nr:unnamed protein product [Adineta steineri]CAF0746795.1 unnamed protein product [Adineta steineri]